ncbi:DUF29 domain-containing protein [Anabaenopsis sp. FSS-46]|jgi:hypothetical protein|uniref:DUF29 domain-containing protein n=1 Tax=Anabaenopsis elenkinii CCIBt3563 TaxID=2779889 RepID=A0A7U3NM97_9CYAN|nr:MULTISPECIES: DUF29 domain-containing protein [Nostocales]MDB9446454.1 DUF29 domain-containing protein [Anabaena sp. CS-542/02]MDH6100740.1 DUF29 domain-containing protein [Anabaenopsis sp. FSS-46]QOV21595.1 DUF29 domain-containing protein [Anabaenopsis elenkinii CCIBt3563]QOV23320.1 DUF29 domain-containing protein [Anabaenopsis elenkinii CCIBt3563]
MSQTLKETNNQLKNLYKQDFYQWIQTTVKNIRNQDLTFIDWENLLAELEDLGNEQKHQLENRLIVLFEHLLKLTYWHQERNYNSRGWKGTIIEQRKQIKKLLKRNPSLKPYLLEIFDEAYQDARDITVVKTGLEPKIFPVDIAFTTEQALDENWLPEEME